MFIQAHKIAQAEYAAFEARFKNRVTEGATVRVPNLIDRIVIALKQLAARPGNHTHQSRRSAGYGHVGAPAK